MKEFYKDVKHWKDYDYVVINDNLNKCYQEIVKIINDSLSGKKIDYDKNFIEKHIEKITLLVISFNYNK